MWDIHVKGCQFAAQPVVNAHRIAPSVMPLLTCMFSVTYTGSSIINEIALIDLPECYKGSNRQEKVNQRDLLVS